MATSQKKPDLGKQILNRFIRSTCVDYVDSLVQSLRIDFKIVNPRKTKLGDCRYPGDKKKAIIITVNGDLPPIQFLITTIHELAHAHVFRNHENRVAAHGKEWKQSFRTLFQPILTANHLPNDEIKVIQHVLANLKATSCSNAVLNDFIHSDNDDVIFLKDIQHGQEFIFQKRKFKRLEKARTRFLCEEIPSKRKYKIHQMANVEIE